MSAQGSEGGALLQESSEQPEKAGQGAAEEELHDHVGLGHLESLGRSSASLGVNSTLVFSLCISNLSKTNSTEQPTKTCYLCLATAFSTYTTCYSMLEYYYIQIFIGMDPYMGGRVSSRKSDTALVADRAKLVRDVRAMFGDMNKMRASARNSLWLGLVSLVISAMMQIDLLVGHGQKLSPSETSCCFFSSCFILMGPAWYLTRSSDFAMYASTSLAGILMTLAETMLIKSDFPTPDAVALLILFSIVGVVPYTVLAFRGPLLPIVQTYIQVY